VSGLRENTVESVLAAVALGARWVEVDVRRTRDDRLVVRHDPTTDDGVFVVDQTAEEVEAKGVVRLETLLGALPDGVGIDLELKTSLEDAPRSAATSTAALLSPLARTASASRPVLVTSFDAAALLTVRSLVPAIPLGLLTWLCFPLRKAIPAAAHLGVQVVGVHQGSFVPNHLDGASVDRPVDYAVEVAHRACLEVMAWCPEPDQAVELVAAGIDAVCVNEVGTALATLNPSGTALPHPPDSTPERPR